MSIDSIKLIAHRGDHEFYLENSLNSFEEAYRRGCDGAELDIQISRDGILVCHHDLSFENTSHRKFNRPISSLDYKVLKRFNVPSLRSVLEWKPKSFKLYLELKKGAKNDQSYLSHVLKLLRQFDFYGDMLSVISFDYQYLKAIHREMSEVSLGLNVYQNHNLSELELSHFELINFHYSFANRSFLDLLKENYAIGFWGMPNDLNCIEELIKINPSLIMSDMATRLAILRNERSFVWQG